MDEKDMNYVDLKSPVDLHWKNEVVDQNDKFAINTYLAWYEKRAPWDQIPVALKLQDLNEIRKRLWPAWQMRIVSDTNVQHNFTLPHRFLEKQKDLCFCRECQAPIPRTLSPQNQRGRSDLRLIKVFRANDGPKVDGRHPFLELEQLLGNPDLESLRRNDFLMVKYDLEEQQKALTAGLKGADAAKAASDFILIQQIDDAKKNIDILRQGGFTEIKLKDFVIEAKRFRKEHHSYLQSVRNGAVKIEKAKSEHKTKLEALIRAMKFAVEASEEGSIPSTFRSKATDQGETLTMAHLERHMKAQKRKSTDEEPLMYPSQTVSLMFLRGKKVIARIGDAKAKSELKAIHFTFQFSDSGDWYVSGLHRETARDDGHVIMNFTITNDEITDMKRAGKTAKMTYHNGFVVFNCFYLVQLLSRIASTMG